MASIIKVQNLRKIYRVGKEKVVALDDICLEIGEGEMCCICLLYTSDAADD